MRRWVRNPAFSGLLGQRASRHDSPPAAVPRAQPAFGAAFKATPGSGLFYDAEYVQYAAAIGPFVVVHERKAQAATAVNCQVRHQDMRGAFIAQEIDAGTRVAPGTVIAADDSGE